MGMCGQRAGVFFLGLGLSVFLLFPCSAGGVSGAESAAGKEALAPVRVAPVETDQVVEQLTFVGTTEPMARSKVATEVSGIVQALAVREGHLVAKGQVLARLDAEDLVLTLKAAQASKRKAEAEFEFAEKEKERYARLKNAESIAGSKYDEVLFRHRSLSHEIARTQAEIERLERAIVKKTVTAPIAGLVAMEHTQVGEWLPIGGPVVTLVDLSHVDITVHLPERYAVHVAPGSRVLAKVASLSATPVPGSVCAVLPEGDPDARTLPVRVRLSNPTGKIKSGMEARLTFDMGRARERVLVPKDAVVTAGDRKQVFVVTDGVASAVEVRVLEFYDSRAAVEGSLRVGDAVVVRGNERLRAGQPVEVVQ